VSFISFPIIKYTSFGYPGNIRKSFTLQSFLSYLLMAVIFLDQKAVSLDFIYPKWIPRPKRSPVPSSIHRCSELLSKSDQNKVKVQTRDNLFILVGSKIFRIQGASKVTALHARPVERSSMQEKNLITKSTQNGWEDVSMSSLLSDEISRSKCSPKKRFAWCVDSKQSGKY